MHGKIVQYILSFALVFFSVPAVTIAASLPAARDVRVAAGATETVEIPIANSKAVNTDFSLSLFSAVFSPGVDQPQLEPLSADIAHIVSLSSSHITVEPHASALVTLSVHPAENIPSRALSIAVIATERIEGDIAFVHGSATLVFVSIGDILPRASCVSFLEAASNSAMLTLANDGGGILYSSGTITLRGMFGIHMGETSNNPQFHRVSPGQSRTWDVALPPIPWWAMGSLSYGVEDAQFQDRLCGEIDAGKRWLPLYVGGVGMIGLMVLYGRRRIA